MVDVLQYVQWIVVIVVRLQIALNVCQDSLEILQEFATHSALQVASIVLLQELALLANLNEI